MSGKEYRKKPPVNKSAQKIHRVIIHLLKKLLRNNFSSPLHPEFIKYYNEMLKQFQNYQNEIISNYSHSKTCQKGCAYCCYHWVEDVYSFEAEIIGDFIKKNYPERINAIISALREDERILIDLNTIVEKKLTTEFSKTELTELKDINSIDLLLASFYQLKRPCILLSEKKTCLIYPVRPLTCRIYISFSKPELCSPEYINKSDMATYLLDLEESASDLLDKLHDKYDRYQKSGLRALLIDYLSE